MKHIQCVWTCILKIANFGKLISFVQGNASTTQCHWSWGEQKRLLVSQLKILLFGFHTITTVGRQLHSQSEFELNRCVEFSLIFTQVCWFPCRGRPSEEVWGDDISNEPINCNNSVSSLVQALKNITYLSQLVTVRVTWYFLFLPGRRNLR